MFNLPIITITAFIGFVSGLNVNYEHIHIILGGMSLYASLLKSYFSYLKISQKSENHRIAYIQYGQIANEIRLEMALEPSIRKPISMLLELIRIKMKNLNEVSEIIESRIINDYISQLDPDNSERNFIQRLIQGKRLEQPEQPDQYNHMRDVGRPNILKLANRFESYVDIENKVIQMQSPQGPAHFRRSSSGMSPNQRNMITSSSSRFHASSASDSGSSANEIIVRAPDGHVIGTEV